MKTRALIVVWVLGLAATALFACGEDAMSPGDAGPDSPDTSVANDSSVDSSIDAPGDALADGVVMDASMDGGCFVDASSPFLVDVVDVSIGADFGCAVRQDGSVVCWGTAPGNGKNGTAWVPVTIKFASDGGVVHATRVAAGAITSCALDTTGGVWCWGSNIWGALGSGALPDFNMHLTATRVVDGTFTPITAVDIGNGIKHMCALSTANKVLCWGANDVGELVVDAGPYEAGPGPNSPVAIEVGLTLNNGQLARGGAGDYSCGTAGSTVACWGWNGFGQCAQPVTGQPVFNPDEGAVLADSGATFPLRAISHGLPHACAIDNAGQVFCWGDNQYLQRGVGPTTGSQPNRMIDLAEAGVTSIACSYNGTCVVDSAKHALCMGANGGNSGTAGLLGTGDAGNFNSGTPLVVVDLDGGGPLHPVARVYGGGSARCAVLEGACGSQGPGQLVCWGFGKFGELGNDASVNTAIPVPVLAP